MNRGLVLTLLPNMVFAGTLALVNDKVVGSCKLYSNLLSQTAGNVNIKVSDCDFGKSSSEGIIVSTNNIDIATNEPVPIVFNKQIVGTTSSKQFTIRNTGTTTLNITSINAYPSDGFSIANSPTSILSGSIDNFQVEFRPLKDIVYKSNIIVINSTKNTPSYTFSIQGTGVASESSTNILVTDNSSGSVIPASSKLDFGKVKVLESTEKTLAIHNIGSSNISLQNPNVTGTSALDFTTTVSPIQSYPINIPPRTSANLKIQFRPLSTGLRVAAVAINSSYSFTVMGTGDNTPINNDPGIGTGLWQPKGTSNIFVVDQSMPGGNGSTTYIPGCSNYGDYATTNCESIGELKDGSTMSIRYKPTTMAGTTPSNGSMQVGSLTGGTMKRLTDAWLSKTPPSKDITDSNISNLLSAISPKCQNSSNKTATIITGIDYCYVRTTDSVWYLNIRPRSSNNTNCANGNCVYKIDENSHDLK
jgi:hypothetical protein